MKVHEWFASEKAFLRTPVGIFLLGAFIGELSPDPTDAIHFWLQEHVLNNPAYTIGFRAGLQVFDWYFMSASYFLILLIVAYLLHVKNVRVVKRVTLIAGILSVGAAVGILAQFFMGA
jgi:hypothetical protein